MRGLEFKGPSRVQNWNEGIKSWGEKLEGRGVKVALQKTSPSANDVGVLR